jgi:TonB family protein
VSLEKFRTQVLLLHNEQTTLDTLSNGFGDGYTVHCATSGSEALGTLVDTPIDVIVSAQDLHGMSGLEALREARKRSPETIGILLAGETDNDIEALVGDQEVFQVVRGGITAATLRSLVDNATSEARLQTIAESANDTSANLDEPATEHVDEPVAEHIVMETSTNGSTVISNGTGRMRALNPNQVLAAAKVQGRTVDVLVVTRDEGFLATVKDSARGIHNVLCANTIGQADEALQNHAIGVAIVDAAMTGPDVEAATLRLRAASPRLVCIVAGRRDDGEMLMDMINRSKVYRFLLKPVSPGRARLAIDASVKHHLEAPDTAFQPVSAPTSTDKSDRQPDSSAAPQNAASATPVESAPRQVATVSTVDDAAPGPVAQANVSNAAMPGVSAQARSAARDSNRNAQQGQTSKPAMLARITSLSSIVKVGAAAAVLVTLAIGWWALSDSDGPDTANEPTATAPAESEVDTVADLPPAVPPAPAIDIDSLLKDARAAAAAGQIIEPQGNNAVELYLAAVAEAPADERVATEFAAVIEQALGVAEAALLERRADIAATALSRVGSADPDNARLPFLTAQLGQIQLRGLLDDARNAIDSLRFDDARAALERARALDIDDGSAIAAVEADLRRTLGDQRIEDVLAQAGLRLEEGQLTAPSNDNARYYYELVLSNDPENPVARQGLIVVASKLVLQARTQIDAGDFSAADILLADAQRLDPNSLELAETSAALTAARYSEEQQRLAELQRAAEEQAEAERIAIAQAEAEAEAEAERIAAADAEAARIAAAQAEAVRIAATTESNAAPDAALTAPAAPIDNTAAAGASGTTGGRSANETSRPEIATVAMSSLTRTKYVAPKYPRTAERRRISGWVDVLLTIDIDGTIEDVVVKDTSPDDVFVSSALAAVKDWEFEPTFENGVAVKIQTAVRLMFAVE